MGVPAFFKWLTLRYPKIVIEASLKRNQNSSNYEKHTGGINLNVTNSQPEVDNLYLDLNGIIHPCCHPQDRPQPQSLDEMFNDIFEYIDLVVNIIGPKKLIYIAIDGVAPRAKMNQQRSRRFRAALEAKENKQKEEELRKEWKSKGLNEVTEEKKFVFDSNTITPGTEFMEKLSEALELFISHRTQFDYNWKGRVVIFSNASVPGEGEHKILDFIRYQRSLEDYDINTSHCIYGADADLIMLSLITHEPNFCIIRESINDNSFRKCDECGKLGHSRLDCPKVTGRKEDIKTIRDIEFSIMKISVLREYLSIEFRGVNFPFKYNFERIIDDFIFLCFFAGNDFLPHLPSIKIREGGIDALLFLYKNLIPYLDGYLTDRGRINLKRTELIFKNMALIEEEFFREMTVFEENQKKKKITYNKGNTNFNGENPFNENARLLSNFKKFNSITSNTQLDNSKLDNKVVNDEIIDIDADMDDDLKEIKLVVNKVAEIQKEELKEIKFAKKTLDKKIQEQNDQEKEYLRRKNLEEVDKELEFIAEVEINPQDKFKEILKEKIRVERKEIEDKYQDPVKLGEKGWKERYYQSKFSININNDEGKEFLESIKTSYIEGLCWVFEYYYNGCVSWDWYYPFHYSPFVSDLQDIKNLKIEFSKGEPFEPVEQLLSVLPPDSCRALPACLRKYMLDKNSEIIDFYPSNFLLDINGQPFAWMGVNLIPFIEEDRIKEVVQMNKKYFSDSEMKRNKWGKTRIFKDFKANNQIVGFKPVEDELTNIPMKDLKNGTGLTNLKISVVKDCKIISYLLEKLNRSVYSLSDIIDFKLSNKDEELNKHLGKYSYSEVHDYKTVNQLEKLSFFNRNDIFHKSEIKNGVKFPVKIVYEDNLDAFSKRNYKGDIAINLVKKALGLDYYSSSYNPNKYDVNEYKFKNQYNDRSNNNNRGVSYDPREMNYLRKKQILDNKKSDNINDYIKNEPNIQIKSNLDLSLTEHIETANSLISTDAFPGIIYEENVKKTDEEEPVPPSLEDLFGIKTDDSIFPKKDKRVVIIEDIQVPTPQENLNINLNSFMKQRKKN